MQTTQPNNKPGNFILIFLNTDLNKNYILTLFFPPTASLSAPIAGYLINVLVQRINISRLQ